MSTTIEIQAMIDEFESNLATLNTMVETGGRLKATELKSLLDLINTGYKAIFTEINESKIDESGLPAPVTDTNLFSGDLIAVLGVYHDLNSQSFSMGSMSPPEDEDYSFVFNMLRDSFRFAATDAASTPDSLREIGIGNGRITLKGQNEIYYNRSVYNTSKTALSLQNASYKGTWTTRLANGVIYLVDCFVTGRYTDPSVVLAYTGRLKGSLFLNPTTHTAVFMPSSYTTDHSLYDPGATIPTMDCRLNLTGDKVTLELRNSKIDYPTTWKYEIQLRTL